jgi:hypothetical protein
VNGGGDFHEIIAAIGKTVSDAESVEIFRQFFRKSLEVSGLGQWLQSQTLPVQAPISLRILPAGESRKLLLERAFSEMMTVEI